MQCSGNMGITIGCQCQFVDGLETYAFLKTCPRSKNHMSSL
jgi:hypothetical protein